MRPCHGFYLRLGSFHNVRLPPNIVMSRSVNVSSHDSWPSLSRPACTALQSSILVNRNDPFYNIWTWNRAELGKWASAGCGSLHTVQSAWLPQTLVRPHHNLAGPLIILSVWRRWRPGGVPTAALLKSTL